MKKTNEKTNEKKDGKVIKEERKDSEKKKGKKIKKNYIELLTTERANLKQLSKRKFIAVKANKQILALLLFDKGTTMTEVMEELALSPQTLLKWRGDFKDKRMESLLVILEKKKDEDEKNDKDNDEQNPAE